MEELRQEIEELIDVLDILSKAIILGITSSKEEYLKKFTGLMLTTFPKIIECYTRPEFGEVQSDMQYWINQLSRLLEVLQQDDLYKIVDVLNFETKENLTLFLKMTEEMEG